MRLIKLLIAIHSLRMIRWRIRFHILLAEWNAGRLRRLIGGGA